MHSRLLMLRHSWVTFWKVRYLSYGGVHSNYFRQCVTVWARGIHFWTLVSSINPPTCDDPEICHSYIKVSDCYVYVHNLIDLVTHLIFFWFRFVNGLFDQPIDSIAGLYWNINEYTTVVIAYAYFWCFLDYFGEDIAFYFAWLSFYTR